MNRSPETLYYHVTASPVGDLAVVVDADHRLVRIEFLTASGTPAVAQIARYLSPAERLVEAAEQTAVVERQLGEYFTGERRTFDLELAPRGTPFQQDVWRYLQTIPFGATCSYSQVASGLGRPGASRAVGRANATNPIPIVVPCHRVIGADGSLTGFGGGLEAKRGLLDLERAGERPVTQLAFGWQAGGEAEDQR